MHATLLMPRNSSWARRQMLGAAFVALTSILLGPPALAAAADAPLRVVVLSDFNGSYGSTAYTRHVDEAVARAIALKPDLVISTGDMVAGQRLHPPLTRAQIEPMWRAFHDKVSDPLARAGVPFVAVPGNHDASSGERFRLEREIYREQWAGRKPALDFVDATHYPFRYAFRVKGTLFVAIDATFVGHLSREERDWLAALLEREGPKSAHRVVFSHMPLWPFTVGRETEYLGDPELEAILKKARVDLFLSGHHHAYYPGAKDGVRHVSQACLGAGPRPLIGTAHAAERAITVLDFDGRGDVQVEAYSGPGYTRRIERASLPERIVSPRATLLRDDLAGFRSRQSGKSEPTAATRGNP